VTFLLTFAKAKSAIVKKSVSEWLNWTFQVPLEILKEYMQFCFLCCEICQLLRDRLDEGLAKCEEIAFLRQIRSNICWRVLSGMDERSNLQLYMPQVIDIFKVSSLTYKFASPFSILFHCYSLTLISVLYRMHLRKLLSTVVSSRIWFMRRFLFCHFLTCHVVYE